MKHQIIYYSAIVSSARASWGFIRLIDENDGDYEAGYGSIDAESDAKARIAGCLTTLLHLEVGKFSGEIQLRTDCLDILDFSQQVLEGWHRLPENINVSLEKAVFKKVSCRDAYFKKANMYAKIALGSIKPEDGFFCYRDSKRKEFKKCLLCQNSGNAKMHGSMASSKCVPWCFRSETGMIYLPTEEILLGEDVHLKVKNVVFQYGLRGNKAITPIAVRLLSQGKYSLIVGLSIFCTAKLLHIPSIPAIVTDLNREEFVKKYMLPKYMI